MHAFIPLCSLNVEARQGTQLPLWLGPYVPAGQGKHELAPATLELPNPHGRHTGFIPGMLYVPGGHGMHVEPLEGLVCPPEQKSRQMAVSAGGVCSFQGWQSMQYDIPPSLYVATEQFNTLEYPVPGVYVLPGDSTQTPACNGWYAPAGHG